MRALDRLKYNTKNVKQEVKNGFTAREKRCERGRYGGNLLQSNFTRCVLCQVKSRWRLPSQCVLDDRDSEHVHSRKKPDVPEKRGYSDSSRDVSRPTDQPFIPVSIAWNTSHSTNLPDLTPDNAERETTFVGDQFPIQQLPCFFAPNATKESLSVGDQFDL